MEENDAISSKENTACTKNPVISTLQTPTVVHTSAEDDGTPIEALSKEKVSSEEDIPCEVGISPKVTTDQIATCLSENETSEKPSPTNNNTETSTADTAGTGKVETVKQDASETVASPAYDPKFITYEGDIAVYTDPTTNYQYTWNTAKEEWQLRTTYGFEDDTHTYTDSDGVKYFWDKEKNAWFPKIDEDFMVQYQMNYGFIDNTLVTKPNEDQKADRTEEPKTDLKVPTVKKKGEKRKASDPSWFELDDQKNTKVYISNLPLDLTEEEFTEMMQRYGIIMKDPDTNKLKIKMYTEPNTTYFKGDALCTYVRIESVDLAIKLLDGTDLRGKKLKVEKAKFQMRGDYDPKLKPKSKKKKEKQKLRKLQEKLFDWRPEKMRGERAKHERTVIVKNVFDPEVFEKDVGLILEYQQDLREECAKCGDVRKVIVYDRHPEGVIQVNMKDPESAEACVSLLNGRWFGKRKLTAEIWDGRTKFKIAETDSQISQRLDNWDKFLEDEHKDANADDEHTPV